MDFDYRKLYGLIGFPLTHSFSKDFFNNKFLSEKINAEYVNFELSDVGDMMELVSEYPDLCGLNVTLPYKEQVIPYMDEMDSNAHEIGAVNVIKFIRTNDGNLKFKGYNSDFIGFRDSLIPILNPNRNKALILGTGGASKAVKQALKSLGIEYLLVSRQKHEGMITYGEITPKIMADYKIIVNTTPLGMYPHVDECPDIPYELLTSEHLCYDLLYNPDTTLFMQKAKDMGAEVKNGLEMLLLQAFESWRIWTM